MTSSPEIDDLLKQARTLLRRRQCAQAIGLFEQVLERDPDHRAAHEGLAAAHFLSKNYQPAADAFARLTRLDPLHGKAWINLGAVYNRMGEYKKAADALRRGIQRDQKCSEGYYNLGLAYRGLNQPAMAVSAYREALRYDPRMAEAHQNLANVYLDMHNPQQALAHYRQALEINPAFERARQGLATAESAVAESQRAISPFGRLVDANAGAAQTAPRAGRALSDEQRTADRQTVHASAVAIAGAAESFLKQLRHEVERTLLALNRAASQTTDSAAALANVQDDFHVAVERSRELHRQLRQQVERLRAHEESLTR